MNPPVQQRDVQPGASVRQWIGPGIVAIVGFYMLASIWATGPDPVVDFGREIYVPWRLSEGDVLYRDIHYFNGPLSPYLHAAALRIGGVSLQTLVLCNAFIVIAITTLLYRLILATADHVTAAAACTTFLVMFALAHRTAQSNYNFLTPYSYELPHGIALTLAMIGALWWYALSRKRVFVALGGVLFGLVLLTKAEVQVGAALVVVGWVISLPLKGQARPENVRALLLFVGCAVAPVVFTAVMLWLAMPLGDVLRGLAGSWKWIGDDELNRLPYFKALMGTLDFRASLINIATWSGRYLFIIAPAAGLAWLVRDRRMAVRSAWVGAAVVIGVMWLFGPGISEGRLGLSGEVPVPLRVAWQGFASPLPLIMTIAGVVLLVRLLRRRGEQHDRPRRALMLMLTIFGGAMLGRMLLNATVLHYGFALAMPAMIVTVALLVGWLPRWIEARGRGGVVLRAAALAALGFVLLLHGRITLYNAQQKQFNVARGADFFAADGRGPAVDMVVLDLKSRARAGETLLCAPEGLIINYLARMKSPTGHLNFTPPALIMYGEQRMVRDLQASPPDFVALVHVVTPEYGAPLFGRDYGRDLAAWIEANYHPVQLFGMMPFEQDLFGILLLKRNGSAAGAEPRPTSTP